METFTLRHVSFTYPGQTRPALDDVELTVRSGEFLVLCGPSGSGKSTLLRQLKPALTPHGERSGEVLFEGSPLESLDRREQARRIGFVLQSPEDQTVTDKVWHELAFGLESLGCDSDTIRRRVAETASFFGIQEWFHKDVDQLSGGQKQLLNLASVMVMEPSVLILDEPTSQLDPIAATDFLAVVARINRELGTTVLLTEHRLEEVFALAGRVAVMNEGRILASGTPAEVGLALRERGSSMFLAMPTPMRVWAAAPEAGETCPVTVRDGRDWLADRTLGPVPPEPERAYPEEPALEAEGLWFKYEKNGPDIVRELSLSVRPGEFLALLGSNGAGKTTAVKLLSGLIKPYRGQVRRSGAAGVLPQDPKTLFVKETVHADLLEALPPDVPDREERVARAVRLCRLEGLLDRHPYDLSGGEQQRAALAKVLLLEPRVLFLDEPTKGLDGALKQELAAILASLLAKGAAILMVSHDVEFCAQYAHRCALFFDGAIVNAAAPRAFFSGNSFYTTAANRMARDRLPQAVTAADLICACGGTAPAEPRQPQAGEGPELPPVRVEPPKPPAPLPRWRKAVAWLCAALASLLLLHFLGVADLRGVLTRLGITNRARQQLWLYGGLSAALIALGLALGRRRPAPVKRPKARRRLSPGRALAVALVLLLIPLTLAAGTFWLEDRRYYFISLLIVLECIAAFFLAFEGRRPQTRELVLLAVLCAIGVAGRQVFYMLPEFKPVAALVVVSGAALGAETGFLVGSVTMLASNMLFSQGPWTPWQMFAMGLVGFLSGLVFRRLRPTRTALCVYGAAACVVIYGGIMNLQSALTWAHTLNWPTVLSYLAAGFPMDCVHAAAAWVFLWFGGEAMLEKLERMKRKYGLTP